MADPVQRRGYTYVNVDLAGIRPPTGVRGDAERLPFRTGAFSLVTSVDTLEHFGKPWNALAEARRVLAPGGRLVISVPWMHPFHGDDLWRFSPLGLRLLLDEAGFRVEEMRGCDGLFTAMASTLGARAHRVELPLIRVAKRLDRLALRFGGSGEATAHSLYVLATTA